MTKNTTPGRPSRTPAAPFGPDSDPLHRHGKWVWAPLQRRWLRLTPEELVRQEFVYRLHTQWRFSLDQMAQERRTQVGRGSSRADVVICQSAEALAGNRDYRVVVEFKAENVTIQPDDYGQGESYARAVGAEFLVLHNEKETAFFRLVPGAPGDRVPITSIPAADDLHDDERLEAVRRATKVFTRDEFQRVLFECHSILRDNHKMDPGAAFDEISKILFIKMAFERIGHAEVFTTDRLNELARSYLVDADSPEMLNNLFTVTKQHYQSDQLFADGEDLRASMASFKRIVKLLERFNLSNTGDDVKGIAFERFLGQTFRGELGQFFTPRPIVEFMVDMLDPKESELICDPASGTGGFLIRAFEHLRDQIERDIQEQKETERARLEREAKEQSWNDDDLLDEVEAALHELNRQLDPADSDSRLWAISHERIFGVDAEPRAARTSKMNMIMHGDGHGGIHYHDGLLDANGIFPGRFDVVMTNPPFGASVGYDQIIGTTEQTRITEDPEAIRRYTRLYGSEWHDRHHELREASRARRPILELYDIGRDPIGGPIGTARVRKSRTTETLFVERCLQLLKPGGRMGIVLPDGILNNPSMQWLRDYVRGRAQLSAVISIPRAVFASAKATVKTSLVFLKKFTDEDDAAYKRAVADAREHVDRALQDERDALTLLERQAAAYGRAGELGDLIEEMERLRRQGDVAALRAARRRLTQHLTLEDRQVAKDLQRQAKVRRAEVDEKHKLMLRDEVDRRFDYPVFMAGVDAAGITATGETGPQVPNELPEVVIEYRRFEQDPDAYLAISTAKVT